MTCFISMLLSLGCDMTLFQNFEEEVRSLPGKFSAAKGGIMFVVMGNTPTDDAPAAAAAAGSSNNKGGAVTAATPADNEWIPAGIIALRKHV